MDAQVSRALAVVEPEAESVQIAWVVAPDEEKRFAVWMDCQAKWLNALERRSGGINTRRAYARDVTDFFLCFQAENLMPWQVGRVHTARWVECMVGDGLSEATVNRKLAALSSLYEYASTEYSIMRAGEGEVALWQYVNPFRGRSLRFKAQPYGKAVYPSTAEVLEMLDGIDLTTVTGKRNLALLAGMFATTRRVTEWISIRWGDVHEGPDGMWFAYRYKGGETRRQAIPGAIWAFVRSYLEAAGRWGKLGAGDYLFVAHSDAAGRLPGLPDDYAAGSGHISASYVNALLKRYGERAGIDAGKLHAHAMRHAGARCRKEDGADVFELKDVLGHKSISTTQIYSDAVLENPTDARGEAIMGKAFAKQLRLLK